MNRRSFLQTSLLAAPALLTLGSLPALAGSTGSTYVQSPGVSATGAFDIPGFNAGGNGVVNMAFNHGPSVDAQFGPRAVDRMRNASAGDRFSVIYGGPNGGSAHHLVWTLTQATLAGARAQIDVIGGVQADAFAVVGGDQYQGAGAAAMVVAALSTGSILRGSQAGQLQANVRVRNTPSGMAFGMEVSVHSV